MGAGGETEDVSQYKFMSEIYYKGYLGNWITQLRAGYLVDQGYASVAIGDRVDDKMELYMSLDYYLIGMNEKGLPKQMGMSIEANRLLGPDDTNLKIRLFLRTGFNTYQVFGFGGVKIEL